MVMSVRKSNAPRLGAALVAAGLWASAGAAQAALVNTYSQTDDVWSTPLAPGHALLDVRTSYSTTRPNALSLPIASLAYGLPNDAEIGLWGAYTFTGVGTGEMTSAPAVLNPYFKAQLPWKLGATALGLVLGAQVPTQSGMDSNVAAEGVAVIPLTSALTLDLNLGLGRSLLTSAALGHGGASFYYALPGGQSLVAEACTYLSSAADPSFSQNVGLTVPLASGLTGDVGVAVSESSAGAVVAVSPHAGMTLTW